MMMDYEKRGNSFYCGNDDECGDGGSDVKSIELTYIKRNRSELAKVKVMDMSFDVGKVFQERLASSMGLDKYRYIMEQVGITNVAVDVDFQRAFNGYLYECTGNIEPAFSSKMLATILPEKPIWDRYVVQNLNIQLTGATKKEKLKNAIMLYADMEKWYADFFKTEKGKECIREFDRVLPDYKGISKIKKIDSILWSIRQIRKDGTIILIPNMAETKEYLKKVAFVNPTDYVTWGGKR